MSKFIFAKCLLSFFIVNSLFASEHFGKDVNDITTVANALNLPKGHGCQDETKIERQGFEFLLGQPSYDRAGDDVSVRRLFTVHADSFEEGDLINHDRQIFTANAKRDEAYVVLADGAGGGLGPALTAEKLITGFSLAMADNAQVKIEKLSIEEFQNLKRVAYLKSTEKFSAQKVTIQSKVNNGKKEYEDKDFNLIADESYATFVAFQLKKISTPKKTTFSLRGFSAGDSTVIIFTPKTFDKSHGTSTFVTPPIRHLRDREDPGTVLKGDYTLDKGKNEDKPKVSTLSSELNLDDVVLVASDGVTDNIYTSPDLKKDLERGNKEFTQILKFIFTSSAFDSVPMPYWESIEDLPTLQILEERLKKANKRSAFSNFSPKIMANRLQNYLLWVTHSEAIAFAEAKKNNQTRAKNPRGPKTDDANFMIIKASKNLI